jgi:NAD(P)-dependent dehydrogenase (short-subunit alcohol dehydrogenase family)
MGVLDGKVAIVTGAGKGIGLGEALALAKEGAAVTLVARTKADLDAAAGQIAALGGRALAVPCDVRVREQVEHAVAETVRQFGTVDILVNNAQIIPPPTPILEYTDELQRAVWESGYLGTWLFMTACFPYMKEHGGRIINTCSGAGHGFVPFMSGYAATKEAIRALTRYAAREWGKLGINVNALAPAVITPGSLDAMPPEQRAYIDAMFAVKGWGDAEQDVGRTVVFLAGPDGRHLTGNTISVDGGAAMVV